jgi:hypothetical protein
MFILSHSVPGAPSAVKALLMKSDSILVSWKAPEFPNGLVNQYTVYMQEGSVRSKLILGSESMLKTKSFILKIAGRSS